MKSKFNNYMYYFIVAIVSLIIMFVFPMMGSEVGLEFNFPTTTAGWVVYVGTNLLTAVANMLIFFAFMQQAKVNIKDNEKFKEANEILIDLSIKGRKGEAKPRSPKHWQSSEYARKGTSLFLGTLASSLAMTNAVLRFDYIALISYIVAVIFAIIFGLFQMKVAENYWIDEYYRYAYFEKKAADEKAEQEKIRQEVAEATGDIIITDGGKKIV